VKAVVDCIPCIFLQALNASKRITTDEKKLVGIAARIPNRIPPDFQCPKLLEIRARMVADGFECSK